MTIIAVGFFFLDGVLLLLAGLWSRALVPVVSGVLCLMAAGGVWLYWLHHRRQVAELAAARRAVKAEVEALRHLVRGGPPA